MRLRDVTKAITMHLNAVGNKENRNDNQRFFLIFSFRKKNSKSLQVEEEKPVIVTISWE